MEKLQFSLKSEYIDLLQLLKATGIASSGGEAKMFVTQECIYVNSDLEHRKRRKLREGDKVVFDNKIEVTLIISEPEPQK